MAVTTDHTKVLTSKQWLLLMISMIYVLFVHAMGAVTKDIHYVIPNNTATHGCPGEYKYQTLNQWINSNASLFTNGTRVMLLNGVHHINSTKSSLVMRNNGSLS